MFLSKLGYSELVQRLFETMTFFLVDPLALLFGGALLLKSLHFYEWLFVNRVSKATVCLARYPLPLLAGGLSKEWNS